MGALLLILAGAIAYGNSLHGPFIFDDYRSIEDNSTIRQLWPMMTVLATKRDTPIAGRPVVNLSFALNYAIGGMHVEGYHVVNVTLHLLVALTLFGVLRRTFAASVAKPQPQVTQPSDLAAFLCTLIWVVHPLNSETVDYVTQRSESMGGLLWLLTLYASIRAWSAEGSGRWQAVAVAACVCGIAAKESVATVPIMVILYDRVFVCDSFRMAFARRGRLYAALAGGWVVFAALVWQAPFLHRGSFFSPGGSFGAHVSTWTYLVNQAPVVVTYLGLSVLPRALVLDYGSPGPISLLAVWPSALLVLTLMVLVIAALVRLPRIGFWGAWFFITLAPASSVVPIPTEVGAERRMYLPLISVIVAAVLAARAFSQRLTGTRAHAHAVARTVGALCASIVVIAFMIATWQRNAEYRSALSIWQTVLDRRPHPRAHVNLAAALGDAGRVDEALAHLRVAAPEFLDARRVLGLELLLRGDNREAIAQLAEFVRLAPSDPDIVQVRKGLAAAYVRVGDFGGAKVQLEAVAMRAPEDTSGHLDLGDVLLWLHDTDGAVAQYRECLRLQPNDIVTLTHVTQALASIGKADDAIESLLANVRLNLARATELQRSREQSTRRPGSKP